MCFAKNAEEILSIFNVQTVWFSANRDVSIQMHCLRSVCQINWQLFSKIVCTDIPIQIAIVVTVKTALV